MSADEKGEAPAKSEEDRYADRIFPTEINVGIKAMRVGAKFDPTRTPGYLATYALNAPSMKEPVVFTFAVDRPPNVATGAFATTLDSALPGELGLQLLAMASDGAIAREKERARLAETPKLSRVATRFTQFDDGAKPTKAIVEIDGVDPEALQAVLRIIQDFAHPPT